MYMCDYIPIPASVCTYDTRACTHTFQYSVGDASRHRSGTREDLKQRSSNDHLLALESARGNSNRDRGLRSRFVYQHTTRSMGFTRSSRKDKYKALLNKAKRDHASPNSYPFFLRRAETIAPPFSQAAKRVRMKLPHTRHRPRSA